MYFIHQNLFKLNINDLQNKWREIYSIVQYAGEATKIFPNDTLLKASKNT